MKIHNELSQVLVTARPIDTSGDPHVPTTARYRVDDKISGNEMVAYTDLTPSSSMLIVIPPAVNTIINTENKYENKVVTLALDEGLDTQFYTEYEYKVKNLQFVE